VDAVSPILVERAREPQGLRNMWILSLVVHGVATVMLLMMPTPSLEDDSLKNVMTISLGGAPGVRTGGMTNMSARTAEASPAPEKAPPAPPAAKVPEMVLPTKKEPLKPTPSKGTEARVKPVPKALEATQGDARIETSARGAGFGRGNWRQDARIRGRYQKRSTACRSPATSIVAWGRAQRAQRQRRRTCE